MSTTWTESDTKIVSLEKITLTGHTSDKTGIEQHIKRAQLRWSGHLVRMADDRIPKDVFYGELDSGHRTQGGQRKRYKGRA